MARRPRPDPPGEALPGPLGAPLARPAGEGQPGLPPGAPEDATDAFGRPDPPGVRARKKAAAGRSAFSPSHLQEAAAQLDAFIAAERWGAARPIHFVVLYARMHERVYRVPPVWTAEDRRRAGFLASAALSKEFGGDGAAMAEFMRWVWRRELRKVKWCRDNDHERTKTISWRYQWGGVFLTEYRAWEKEYGSR